MVKRELSVIELDGLFLVAFPAEWQHSATSNRDRVTFRHPSMPTAELQMTWRESDQLPGLRETPRKGLESCLLGFAEEHLAEHLEIGRQWNRTQLEGSTFTSLFDEWVHCVTFADLDADRQYLLGLLIHEPSRYFWFFEADGPVDFVEDAATLCRRIRHIDEDRELV